MPNEKYKEQFDQIWKEFPKQRIGNKAKGLSAYQKAIDTHRTTHEECMQAVLRYKQSDEVVRGFAKGFQAWINADKFNDEYIQPKEIKAHILQKEIKPEDFSQTNFFTQEELPDHFRFMPPKDVAYWTKRIIQFLRDDSVDPLDVQDKLIALYDYFGTLWLEKGYNYFGRCHEACVNDFLKVYLCEDISNPNILHYYFDGNYNKYSINLFDLYWRGLKFTNSWKIKWLDFGSIVQPTGYWLRDAITFYMFQNAIGEEWRVQHKLDSGWAKLQNERKGKFWMGVLAHIDGLEKVVFSCSLGLLEEAKRIEYCFDKEIYNQTGGKVKQPITCEKELLDIALAKCNKKITE